MRRAGARRAVVTACLTLLGVVGEAYIVGGAENRRTSARAGTRASLGAIGGDGPVTRAAAKSAGFLGSQSWDPRASETAVSLAAAHINVGGEMRSYLEIVDVGGDAGSHGDGCFCLFFRRACQRGGDSACV